MRWRNRERSENVKDQRGVTPRRLMAGGGIAAIVLALLAAFLGKDNPLGQMLGQLNQQKQQQAVRAKAPDAKDEVGEFIRVMARDNEIIWTKLFAERGRKYRIPELVMFSGQVRSGCGAASSQMGPFYCPADQKIYIDPTFFEDLAREHNAEGDFAHAYVIAHEAAHHVQNLLGWNQRLNQARAAGANKVTINRESVRLELQADYLAGVWAHHMEKKWQALEPGDIREGINAANQIGDDTLQMKSLGRVVPRNFNHGTAEQRERWLMKGLATGDFDGATEVFELPYDRL